MQNNRPNKDADNETLEDIRDRINQGKTNREIARSLGISEREAQVGRRIVEKEAAEQAKIKGAEGTPDDQTKEEKRRDKISSALYILYRNLGEQELKAKQNHRPQGFPEGLTPEKE